MRELHNQLVMEMKKRTESRVFLDFKLGSKQTFGGGGRVLQHLFKHREKFSGYSRVNSYW